MNKYHSTMSRRDFMKALGVAGGAMAVIAIAPPLWRCLCLPIVEALRTA